MTKSRVTHALGILAFLFLCACGSSGGGGDNNVTNTPPVATPPARDPAAVEAFRASVQDLGIEDFYEAAYLGLVARTPQTAIGLGLDEEAGVAADELNNLSAVYQADTTEMFTIALDTLRGYDRATLDAAGRIDYDVFEWYLADEIERASFENFGFPATYGNFGIPSSLVRFFSDVHPLETAADAEAYIARLGAVEKQLGELEDLLIRQADAGVVEPRVTLDFAISQLGSLLRSSAGNTGFIEGLFDRLSDIPELSNDERTALVQRAIDVVADSVLPAYESLVSRMTSLVVSSPGVIGVSQYAGGDAYYAYELRHHTTTDLTPVEVHELGLAELERIKAEMRDVFDQLNYPDNETLAELFDRVASDGGTVLAADGLATFENLITNAEAMIGEAFDVAPSTPVVVKPDPFGGFYIGPSLDGTRPGAFFAGTEIDQPYYLMPSLTYHESIPGHHMQIGVAADQDVPTFRKVVRSTGYVEGWALYAERVAAELGWYDGDPYGDLGRLQYEALRAVRLVLDTAIHAPEYRWSFDQAAQYNRENTGFSLSSSQGAAARYSISPGQASGYMIGMLRILEERSRAQTALGGDFDLGAFHAAVLTAGSVPLDVLPAVVDEYIAAVEAGR